MLRVSLGVLILLHGIAKVIAGPAFVTGLVAKAGLPPALGYLVYVGEVVAPIPLIIGLWVRPAAIIVAINMLTAILLVHIGEIFSLNTGGGWAIELQGMFLIAAVSSRAAGRRPLEHGRQVRAMELTPAERDHASGRQHPKGPQASRRLRLARAQGLSRQPGTAPRGRRRLLRAALPGAAAHPCDDRAVARHRRRAASGDAERVP